MNGTGVNAVLLDALKDLRSILKRHCETNIISRRTGKAGHDGDGNSWSAVAIPEWEVRQKIAELDATIDEAEKDGAQ